MQTRVHWFGLAIVAAVLLWFMAASGNWTFFFDPTSAVFMVGIVTGGLWAGYGPRRIKQAFAIALFGQEGDRADAAKLMEQGTHLSWGAGMLYMVFGLITMLRNMDDPAAIGPGMGGRDDSTCLCRSTC